MALTRLARARISRIATGVAFLAGVLFLVQLIYSIGPAVIATILSRLEPLEIILILLFPLLTLALLIIRYALIFHVLGQRVPFLLVVSSSLAGSAVGSVVPGGEVADLSTRILLLGRSGVPTHMAILASVIEGFARFAVNAVLLFVAAVSLLSASFREPGATTILLIGTGVALVGLITLGVLLSKGVAQWFIRTANVIAKTATESDIRRAEQAFSTFFRTIRPRTTIIFVLTVLGFFWEPIQIFLMLDFLNFPLPFWQAFWLYHVLILPRLLPIPGGVGVTEGGGALFSTLVGVSGAVGVAVSLLARLRSLPYIIVGLFILPLAGFFKISAKQ